MKRTLIALSCLVLFALPAFGQGGILTDSVLRADGTPAIGATVRVCTEAASGTPCSPTASIYSDKALTIGIGPTLAVDAGGAFYYYAAPGFYKEQFCLGSACATRTVLMAGDVTALVVGTSTLGFSATPTFDSSASSYFSMTLTGNVTSSTISNPYDGRVIYFNICQDATGGRTFAWPASVLTPPTVGTAASSCTSASFIYDGTNWRELAASSRGSAEFETVTTATYVDLIEQGSAPADPAGTTGRLYVLTADDILRIKRGATVVALVDDTNAQTIAGAKTFSSIPVLPASDPTASEEATRKSYVDARKIAWRGGFWETAPVAGLTNIPLPVADQCATGISVEAVSVVAITKGSGTMTFNVTRYSNNGVSQGSIFTGNRVYSNTGDNRQDYTPTITTALATNYFRFNLVTVNAQADVTFLVEGKCDVL